MGLRESDDWVDEDHHQSAHGSTTVVSLFQDAWCQGQRPSVEDYWQGEAGASVETLIHLVKVDLKHRFLHGEQPRATEYFQKFPFLYQDKDFATSVVYEEYCLNREVGFPVDTDQFCQRYDRYHDSIHELLRIHDEFDLECEFAPDDSLQQSIASLLNGSVVMRQRHVDRPDHIGVVPDRTLEDTERVGALGVGLGVSAIEQTYLDLSTSDGVKDQHRSGPDRSTQAPVIYPEPGETFQDLRIVREIGRGGSSRVYEAQQIDVGDRQVVLKVFAKKGQESHMLGKLNHEHVMPILYTLAEPTRNLFGLCMPFREGRPLDEILAQLEPVEERDPRSFWVGCQISTRDVEVHAANESSTQGWRGFPSDGDYEAAVAWVVAKLARALAHAHASKVLHCDVKPANILITRDHGPQLMDFNLSRDLRADRSDVIRFRGGTLPYMSPEQLFAMIVEGDEAAQDGRTTQIDERTDIYALGLVFREMLTGLRPLVPSIHTSLERTIAYMAMLRSRRPEPIPSVEGPIREILDRCLDPEPSQRYCSATELADDLELLLESVPADQGSVKSVVVAPQLTNRDPGQSAPVEPVPSPATKSARSGFFVIAALVFSAVFVSTSVLFLLGYPNPAQGTTPTLISPLDHQDLVWILNELKGPRPDRGKVQERLESLDDWWMSGAVNRFSDEAPVFEAIQQAIEDRLDPPADQTEAVSSYIRYVDDFGPSHFDRLGKMADRYRGPVFLDLYIRLGVACLRSVETMAYADPLKSERIVCATDLLRRVCPSDGRTPFGSPGHSAYYNLACAIWDTLPPNPEPSDVLRVIQLLNKATNATHEINNPLIRSEINRDRLFLDQFKISYLRVNSIIKYQQALRGRSLGKIEQQWASENWRMLKKMISLNASYLGFALVAVPGQVLASFSGAQDLRRRVKERYQFIKNTSNPSGIDKILNRIRIVKRKDPVYGRDDLAQSVVESFAVLFPEEPPPHLEVALCSRLSEAVLNLASDEVDRLKAQANMLIKQDKLANPLPLVSLCLASLSLERGDLACHHDEYKTAFNYYCESQVQLGLAKKSMHRDTKVWVSEFLKRNFDMIAVEYQAGLKDRFATLHREHGLDLPVHLDEGLSFADIKLTDR